MPDYKNFNHATQIEVRFADIDAMRHVNNDKYLTYIETARVAYLKDVLHLGMIDKGAGVILAKVTVDFKMPILMDDKVTVYTRCCRMGNKSFDLEYELVRTNFEGAEVVATAYSVLVAFDYASQQTVEMLNEWKYAIENFEDK